MLWSHVGFTQSVKFDENIGKLSRYVTDWISGDRQRIEFKCSLHDLVEAVADAFEIENPRIYVLQPTSSPWQDRILLTQENFNEYVERQGTFAKPTISKLYVSGNTSPDGSPNGKKSDVSEGSQSSKGSRCGQSEFSQALRRRDDGSCVFCYSNIEPLEGAHFIPVKQRDLLNDPKNRRKYGISSIMDTINGILLCWGFHKCFDANLVCIDPLSGKLLIADALLANEPDKWERLVGHTVPVSDGTWPTCELLKFREDAMRT